MTKKSGILLAHVLLFLVNTFYGANYVIAKGIMPTFIGPNAFILIRVLGAGILFWMLFLFNREKVAKKDLGRLILVGLFGVSLNQLFFFNGLMLTSPVNSSIIMTSTPILVFCLSMIFLKERLTWSKGIGIGLGAIGASTLIFLGQKGNYDSSALGDLFILINAMSYGMYLVLVKPLMQKYNPMTVITWAFTFGAIFVMLFPPTWQQVYDFTQIDVPVGIWLRIGFVVLFVTFLAYLFSVIALKHVSPTVTSSYIYFQPLLAALFVLLFFYFGFEDYRGGLTWINGMCGLLIFAGVYLISRKK
jgi:drug/metabolite transporter (DMT)-like permease